MIWVQERIYMNFRNYDLSDDIQQSIERLGFDKPTEIQAKSIPLLKDGKDMIAQSQTGTGKTAAFTLPILEKVDIDLKKPQVLILCPTRELAVQVSEAIKELAYFIKGLNVLPVYGGEPIFHQIKRLKRGVHIIVGTPGRLQDHLNRRTIRPDHLHTVILDEADEMLKMGFRDEIDGIFESIPTDRQTLLFSATMPKPVVRIAQSYMNNPEHIKITRKEVTNQNIEQNYYPVIGRFKNEALARLVKVQNPNQALIFCNTKKGVDQLMDDLAHLEVNCEKIHGDIPQHLRLDTIQRFNNGNSKLLIATDVAARGLDIKGVDVVYNYDVPSHPENYVHRIGRTGRAGRSGIACSLVSRNELKHLNDIMHYAKISIQKNEIPTLDTVNKATVGHTFKNIKETAETKNLEHSYSLIDQLESEGLSSREIAAALMHNAIQLDTRKDIELSYRMHNNRNDRSRKGSNQHNTNTGNHVHVRMNIGYDDDVQVREILGFIRAKSKISKNVIGNISMRNTETYLEVPKNSVTTMMDKLNGIKMGTKKIEMDIPRSLPSSVTRKGNGGQRKSAPRKGGQYKGNQYKDSRRKGA
jgi:ATP-dependent RNA helicase DeaD